MNVSVISRRSFGLMVIALVLGGTFGCAQSGSGAASSLTAPSALAGQTQAKASDPYVVSGAWFVLFTFKHTGEHLGEGTAILTEDADGNVWFTEDDPVHDYALTRVGNGNKFGYRFSILGSGGGPCNSDLSGPAELDTTTEVIVAQPHGTLDDCSKTALVVTMTKQ